MSNPLPSHQQTSYTIEHFYWGKHIQDKEPVGEFRIIATSSGWQLDDANHAFYNRIYGGSHNGVELRDLDTQITIGSISNNARSDLLLAFIERSRYVARSAHYPIYHVLRLPIDLVERFDYSLDQLIQPLYELHTQKQDAFFTNLDQALAPLRLDLKPLPPQRPTALAILLQLPFADSSEKQALLLNQLLNGGKIVIANAPPNVLERLKTVLGFMQWLPPFVRPRIQGGTAVFESADSPLNIQFLHSEIRSAPGTGTLVANWATGSVKIPTALPQHPYALLVTQKSDGQMENIQQTQRDLENLFRHYHATLTMGSDPLYGIAWRYAYDQSHIVDDEVRVKALKALIRIPVNQAEKLGDLKVLVTQAIDSNRTDWLVDMLDVLEEHRDTLQGILGAYRPQKQLIDFMANALAKEQVRLAQWFFQRLMQQEDLASTLVLTRTPLGCTLLKQQLQYRQPNSIHLALELLAIANKKRKNSLEDFGACIIDSVADYDGEALQALAVFFRSPLSAQYQRTLFGMLGKARVPLMRYLPEAHDFLKGLTTDEGLLLFNQALESATLASLEDLWQAIMPTPVAKRVPPTSGQNSSHDTATAEKVGETLASGQADISQPDRDQPDLEPSESQDTFELDAMFHVAFLRHVLRHEAFVVRATDVLLRINEDQWQPTVEEAIIMLRYSQKSVQRDDFYMRMVRGCVTQELSMSNRSLWLQALSEAYNQPSEPDIFRVWLRATGQRTAAQFLWQLRQVTSFMAQSYDAGHYDLDDLPVLSPENQEDILTEVDQLRELLQSFSRGRLFSGKSEEAERILATLDQLSHALQSKNQIADTPDIP